MSVLTIPTAITNAISSLSSHHGHKRGVHGAGDSSAANGTDSASTSSADQASGSTQSLFGTLLDTVEQVVGLQTPTAATGAANPTTAASASSSLNSGKLSASTLTPASITAAQAALKRV